ncbi:protein POLAR LOCALIZATION DURING ASYMMETRIC DIVISION AND REDISTRIBUTION-like [Lolium rigidum]|uniref:protein POLAR LOCALIZATION DURING ASYMMETRIC DIVISION AND REDISTRIBUTION-like n=1 Tax=Lolium rigidum TaxID=89674 RepID=UPI001F5C2620|nr:protein POLAR LOCALIZATION DURING ASYMMETRIC DIVISION AND REDISTRIBUTION-like [Lolium rigidum]
MGSEGATSRRRILDYLNDGEELGVDGPSTPRAVATARSLLPRFRWTRMARIGRKGCGSCAGVKVQQPQQPEEQEIAAEILVEKGDELNDDTARATSSGGAVSGGETRAADLGVGLGLVFLLAKTSDEFSKMAKVRAEMEALLAEFKGHVIANTANANADAEDVSRPGNLDDSAASSCLTDANEPRAANDQSEDRRRDRQVASCSGKRVDVEVQSRRRSTEDVLEEEFHAELERLHVHYGADTPTFPLEEEQAAAESSDDDDDIAADCRQGFAEEDEDDDDHGHDDDDAARYRGVSAVELERRLHELLHQRNQERIEELEAALRRAERRLFDKEMEASLWKDTAKMALRQGHDGEDDELQ